jgi:hypothetical protein
MIIPELEMESALATHAIGQPSKSATRGCIPQSNNRIQSMYSKKETVKYMELKQSSGTRYLGCSGNVPIFSDNFAAAGDKPRTDAQEQPTRCSDEKQEDSTSAIAA